MKKIMTIEVSVSKDKELDVEIKNEGADVSGFFQIAAAVSGKLYQEQLLDSDCQCGHCSQNIAVAMAIETAERLAAAEDFVQLVKPAVKGSHGSKN